MKKFYLSVIVIFSAICISAQQIYVLDLQKSIDIAKEQSYNMLMLQQNFEASKYNLKAATNRFMTNVDLRLDGPSYLEGTSKFDNGDTSYYFNTEEFSYQGQLSINQPLPTDGVVRLYANFKDEQRFHNNSRAMQPNLGVSLSQPLTPLYGYNEIRSEFKRAKLRYERSYKGLKRAELNLIYEVSNIYFQLISAQERKRISHENLLRQQEVYSTAMNKYSAGLIRETEALQMEIDFGAAQNSFDLAEVTYQERSNYFKQRIGISLQDSVVIVRDSTYTDILVNVDKAVSLGLENRMEIREHEIEIELLELNIKRQKAEGMISGDINAYYRFTGQGNGTPDNSFNYMYNDVVDDWKRRDPDRGIGLSIRIPILDWGVNRSLVKAAQAYKQSEIYALELEQVSIEREIRNTVNQLHSSLRRLQLLEKNVELAEKNYAISSQRFSNGDIDAQMLALDRERLNNANITQLDAYISYKLNIADLARKTFYDFVNDKPYYNGVE